MNLHEWITDKLDNMERETNKLLVEYKGDTTAPRTLLRACEGARRIITRHSFNANPNRWSAGWTACDGCGYDDYGPHVENLNDCPELLDLAHALGITPEILKELDRPVAPEREPYVEVKRTWANIDADQAPATFRP